MRGLRWIVLTTARDLLQEGRSGGSDFCHGSVADPAIVAARGREAVSPAGAGSWLLIVSLSSALATYDLQGDDAREHIPEAVEAVPRVKVVHILNVQRGQRLVDCTLGEARLLAKPRHSQSSSPASRGGGPSLTLIGGLDRRP